jgi:hypothetical protein
MGPREEMRKRACIVLGALGLFESGCVADAGSVEVLQIRDGKLLRGWACANALEKAPELERKLALAVAERGDTGPYAR